MDETIQRKETPAFQDRLLLAIKDKGFREVLLAKAAGISSANMQKLLMGHYKPSKQEVLRIADALNVSAEYLLGFTDDDSPHAGYDRWQIVPPEIRERQLELEDEIAETKAALASIAKIVVEHLDESELGERFTGLSAIVSIGEAHEAKLKDLRKEKEELMNQILLKLSKKQLAQ